MLALILIMLIGFAGIVIIIDPYYHYHQPIDGLGLTLNNERYQNYGIARNFEYDAIITGTSMTQNFKASEVDELFGTGSIKTSFSGARYKEVNDYLEFAINKNDDIELIIRGLDTSYILLDKDVSWYAGIEYPTYLYDDNLLNDVNYIFNKSVAISGVGSVFLNYFTGFTASTFDEYSNWMDGSVFGIDAILSEYERGEKVGESLDILTDEDKLIIYENIEQNVISLARDNPDITFYYFYTPYSIAWFDSLYITGEVEKNIEALEYVAELVLECDNIKLYSFFDEYEMICDLDNYRDTTHYHEDINSQILIWMYNEEHLLTSENYEEYFDKILDFYLNYDYDAIWE